MEEEKTSNKKVKIIIAVILWLLLICAIIYIVLDLYNSNKNKQLYEVIQPSIMVNEIEDEITEQPSQVNNKFVDKVKELQRENTDIKAWIRIENTNINYPLLQITDNDYYLTHNYKKEADKYGSIYINSNSNIKDNNSNIIIYGHNKINSTQMFSDLLKYQDIAFYKEHPNIKITTEEGEEEYEIVYVFKSRIFYQDETNVFRYYRNYKFENEKQYNEYIDNCRKIQLYDIGKTASYGEKLITLITCEYSQENGRMVVVAKLSK